MMKAKNGPCTVNDLKTVKMIENLLFLKIFLEYNYVCCGRFCLLIFSSGYCSLFVGFFPSFLLPEGTFASNMLEVSYCFFSDSTMGDPRRFTS